MIHDALDELLASDDKHLKALLATLLDIDPAIMDRARTPAGRKKAG